MTWTHAERTRLDVGSLFLHLSSISLMDKMSANFIVFSMSISAALGLVAHFTTAVQTLVHFLKNSKTIFVSYKAI